MEENKAAAAKFTLEKNSSVKSGIGQYDMQSDNVSKIL
jgi:hypothetical protein